MSLKALDHGENSIVGKRPLATILTTLDQKNEEPVANRSVTSRKILVWLPSEKMIKGKEKYPDIIKIIEHNFELQTVTGKGAMV